MNEFKGTPGPWKVVSDSPEGSEIESEHESTFWAFVSYDTPEAERRPNALLIAAAPELLQALIRLAEAARDMHGYLEGAVSQAEDAIARALGH